MRPLIRSKAKRGQRRGVVYVEYLVVVTFTGLGVLLAVRALGPELVAAYSRQRNALYQPYP